MENISPKLIDFIRNNKICALTTILQDGGPYSSAMYYAFDTNEKVFYFVADINDLKCEALSEQDESFASIVIGFDNDNWRTAQLRGGISIVPVEKEGYYVKTFLEKLPEVETFLNHDERAILKFTPAWWKFTDATDGSITTAN